MAVIDIQVHMAGGSDARAAPIRQISVRATLRGVAASGPTPPRPPVEQPPLVPEKVE